MLTTPTSISTPVSGKSLFCSIVKVNLRKLHLSFWMVNSMAVPEYIFPIDGTEEPPMTGLNDGIGDEAWDVDYVLNSSALRL